LDDLLAEHAKRFSTYSEVNRARKVRNKIAHRRGVPEDEAQRTIAAFEVAIREILTCPEFPPHLRRHFSAHLPQQNQEGESKAPNPQRPSSLGRTMKRPDMVAKPIPESAGSLDDILSEYQQSHFRRPEEGDTLEGIIMAISGESVLLDIGYEVEGIIPLADFDAVRETIRPGDKLPVSVKGLSPEGYYELSRLRVERPNRWSPHNVVPKAPTVAKKATPELSPRRLPLPMATSSAAVPSPVQTPTSPILPRLAADPQGPQGWKKVRINDLARELNVRAHKILDRLSDLGVPERLTHSSSVSGDIAAKLRRLYRDFACPVCDARINLADFERGDDVVCSSCSSHLVVVGTEGDFELVVLKDDQDEYSDGSDETDFGIGGP
jgi:hypothetical protein